MILLMVFVFYYSKYFSIKYTQSEWYKTHLIFGSKSVLLGFLSETNNKIDVFLISFFLSNYYVGIYSFAAEIAKGFLIIGSVVQLNVNPLVSDLWERENISALQKYTWRISKMMLLLMGTVLLSVAVIYPFFVKLFMTDINYLESIPVFYILLPGILMLGIYNFAGGYLSMANFLNVALKNLIIIIIFTVVSCTIFIHFLGFYGAALSTSSTFILTALLIHNFVKNKMGIGLINFNMNK